MPLPAGVETVTVTSGEPLALPDGTPMQGRLIFAGPDVVTIGEDDVVLGGAVEVTLAAGEFTVTLAATDATGMDPTGWTYRVHAVLTNAPGWVRHISLPKTAPAVVLADVLVPDPVAAEFAVLLTGASFLPLSGGTMTGPLALAAGGIDVDVQQAIATGIGTGVIYGGEINASATPSSFDVGLTLAYIIDFITTPTAPTVQTLTIPAQTVALSAGSLARVTTWILADSAGNIIQQGTAPTNTQRRTHVQLGLVAQLGGTIFVDQSIPVILNNPIGQLNDLMFALGAFNVSGNDVAGVAATLQLQKTVGRIFSVGSNYYNGSLRTNDPHVSDIPAQNPVSIRYATQAVGSLEAASTVIKPNTYDLNGVATTIGGVGTRSSIQRVFIAPANQVSDQVIIQYGQQFYATFDEAITAVGTDAFVLNPSIEVAQGVIYWGSIVIQRNATDTTLTNQVRFFPAAKFGGGVAGAAGLSALSAYALLAGAAFTGAVSVNDADLSVLDTGVKGYRLRQSGSALDLEASGADLLLSNWSGTSFNGTQYPHSRYSSGALAQQQAGLVEFVDALYGTVRHTLNGTANTAGFYGAAPVGQQTVTGSRGGNAALADLLTKLATLGLIVDGSSA